MQGRVGRLSSGSPVLSVLAAILVVTCCGAALANEPAAAPQPGNEAKASSFSGAGEAAKRLLCVHTPDARKGLQVHSGPGADQPVTGEFRAEECGIELAGSCRGDWCEMALGSARGWVDTRFIGVYELPRPTVSKQSATVVAPAPERPQPQQRPPAPAAPSAASAVTDTRPSAQHPPRAHREKLATRQDRDSHRHGGATQPARAASACVVGVAWWDTLRIRRGPGVSHGEIGGIPPGACRVERVGGCRGAWCRITWRGRAGWVNIYYLE